MIKLFFLRGGSFLLALGLLFASGCAGTGPSRFYTLSSLHKAGTDLEKGAAGSGPSIRVGPIKFPDYLERLEVVTRSGSNRIELSDFDLWAGFPAEEFSRVFAENLSVLLSTERVTTSPQPRGAPLDYQITMEVIRFDGALGGDVSLIARWTVIGGKDKKSVLIRKSSIVEPSETQGYEAMVAAQSRALEKLSREIAEVIRTLPQ